MYEDISEGAGDKLYITFDVDSKAESKIADKIVFVQPRVY